jgi:hypothetical protein
MQRFSGSLVAFLAALPLLACDGDGHAHRHYGDGASPVDGAASCGDVQEAAIDTDQLVDVEPGAGAGAFIEYTAGGRYRITTTCDAATSRDACAWDVVVSLLDDASIASVAPLALESEDSLTLREGNSVRLIADTSTDFDGFTLDTAPGAAARFDALLDGVCANRYMFWVGDGALHGGAPSNPIDLVPSDP